MNFASIGTIVPGLHPDPYSSKFPPLTRERLDQLMSAMAQQRRRGTAGGGENELGRGRADDACLGGKRRRQGFSEQVQQGELAHAAVEKAGQRSFGGEDVAERSHGLGSRVFG